ncbi:MAG: putative monooxygenase [Candidatus Accumulibacter appositus]|uniref:Putative monooxygenase n=1 Tax=Candidatus Accumulibacter appositus TaxID=1454003 RepID=A0A011Q0F5_9PROT|nr:putative quinol monooxygenase [Accumulibacter sp.]EXI82665.1 MAG: putative monooxygenase [Candidatus Accumulibacter appositus]HRF05292.1 putative quinol monooxygenase [Accumulibacter sp.]
MTIRIMARLTARAGSETALAALLRDLSFPSRDEGGCLGYEVFHNQDDTREFVTVEQWSDQAAADAHLATPHVTEAIRRASDLLAQPPLIHRFLPLA